MNNAKKITILGGTIVLLVSTAGLWAAQEGPPPPTPPPQEGAGVEIRRVPGDRPMHYRMIDDKNVPKEKVPFLGVEAGRVSATVSAQLGLPERTGLTVLRVIDGSPSEGILQEHDILMKLNDQILINEPQLAVLVRNAKTGDDVTLTLLRAAKEMKVHVKLGEHEVPKGGMWHVEGFPHDFDLGDLGPEFNDAAREWGDHARELAEKAKDMAGRVRDDVEHTLRVLRSDDDDEGGDHVFIDERGPMKRVTRINTDRGNIVLVDDQGRVEVSMGEKGRHVLIKDKDGKILFDGPVNTPGERAAMSPDAQKRLKQVESQVDIDYSMNKNTQTKETTIVPAATAGGISFEREAAPKQVRTYML